MAKRVPCVVNGESFDTRVMACDAYNVSYSKVNGLVERGYTVERAINTLVEKGDVLEIVVEPPKEKLVVFGEEYSNALEVAHEYEVPFVTYQLLMDEYEDPEMALNAYFERVKAYQREAIRREVAGIKTYAYRGKEYETVEEIAKLMGVSLVTLTKLSGGRTYDEVGDLIAKMSSKMRKK